MAQSSPQLDMQVLLDLRQRFPEIPEGVVSQCMLQNNNNLEACCRALSQESSKYLYMEYHSPEDNRINRNRLLHINLGIHSPSSYHPGDGAQLNGGRTLVHSSSDGHIDPQHAAGKQLICLVPEPHSAPAVVAATPNYNPFFMNEQNRSAATPPSQPPQQPSSMQTGMNPSAMQGPSPPSYMHIPRYSTNPITVTVSQNLPSGQTVPRALQILPQIPSNLYGSPGSIYIRQTSQSPSGRRTPQSTPWQSSPQGPVSHYSQRPLPIYPHQQNYQPSQYSPKQQQIPQPAYHSPPPSQCPSPYSSPQHQVQPSPLGHPSSHVFMPPSPSTTPPHPYQQGPSSYHKQGNHSIAYLPYTTPSLPKGSMKKIEITVEPSQRSPSPISNQPSPRNQHSLYTATTPPSSSPSRGISSQPKPPFSVNPVYITYTQPTGPSCAPSPSPRVIPNPTTVFKITVGRATTENLLNLVDQEEPSAAPEPIQPISMIPGSLGEKGSHKYHRSSSSGSDDYAYTQALLLHQRARMERLAKQLKLEKEELERLKAEVNGMEHDLMQRRLRRVSCTTPSPTPEEMTRLRSMNRQLQINVDCTLKEVDLLQSRGNFDPKAMNNFYDNIEPGPVVPPKPSKKDSPDPCTVERKARRISVTSKVQADVHDTQAAAAGEHLPGPKNNSQTQPRDEDYEGAPWNCDSCTFLNHPALNRCEQCEMPRYT
ncbi:TGF-beta-activated kinase 1 and MAP3K7-binding protein 3 isoform X1 [Pipistrellus kuhlii]|uniref:TGF-beta activated kinase 1 (MAP3K7) binding protein 3 n=1 Tax=Pipistrellus kuhlii TaxID=59472 RepID=A0A7J7V6H0_PIPKU|nr:TGF-beta-activated kinase 1 and MAP3K7-binding protein 3 isoform X1 [Pipistrellus kuhlii]XP_036295619.1 TGF-beta-activated kinase 1 and MAP3K7-binding protein 3 isoform X1 [Pipistrellus kuhlii]XP_036295620.1 TGF-beta-activated kinase 1 and MAP3K7-binding protein 3 isoform X1 [Pipistrellus kuhlii]XP_045438302.1 TGF-beta-activated kinase 1 and MAP3K7-binding protein 3 isoform X1 [Pipistrellus kuhlii]XP_045438303.1 TGF-beta-activated kinase 1 and MAP3K7-binding protein 3 isoform X1 [Pipistrellu